MCALRKHRWMARLGGIFVVLATSACVLYGCAPTFGYPSYPVYGYAPYSYGVTDRMVYQPEF
ncbi:MAG TPA: hypothetical protein VEF03_08950, partial [Candidatus Binataceae bacterium]|nr:hypothetical protein [Candidatus Binataceae bacterium]